MTVADIFVALGLRPVSAPIACKGSRFCIIVSVTSCSILQAKACSGAPRQGERTIAYSGPSLGQLNSRLVPVCSFRHSLLPLGI